MIVQSESEFCSGFSDIKCVRAFVAVKKVCYVVCVTCVI